MCVCVCACVPPYVCMRNLFVCVFLFECLSFINHHVLVERLRLCFIVSFFLCVCLVGNSINF